MITKSEAISFLKTHQPMPKDENLKEEELNKYDEVREYFMDNPDEQCIPLFLNSFGGKDGLGVYQMIEFVIMMYDEDKVLPHILKALDSTYDGVKYWAVQIAGNYPDIRLFDGVVKCLKSDDEDIKSAAISTLGLFALNNINKPIVIDLLSEVESREKDEYIVEFCREILEDIQ